MFINYNDYSFNDYNIMYEYVFSRLKQRITQERKKMKNRLRVIREGLLEKKS